MNWQELIKGLKLMGIDCERLYKAATNAPGFIRDIYAYKSQATEDALPIRRIMPILYEKGENAGDFRGHYFHQDIWAAKKVLEDEPEHHVDIGSRIDGFVSHIIVNRDITLVDIRNLENEIDGLQCIRADATKLSMFKRNSLKSLSSLHAAEHFGLGRYGDVINPDAHLEFMDNIQSVLQPGGKLYFSVPCGSPERVEFNAHRVLSPYTVVDAFDELSLTSFSGVKDDGRFYGNTDLDELENQKYGCGLFEFTK